MKTALIIMMVLAVSEAIADDRMGSGPLSPNMLPTVPGGMMNQFGPSGRSDNPNANLVATFRQRGIQAYNSRNFAQARQFFQQALMLDPSNQSIQFELMETDRALSQARLPSKENLEPFLEDSLQRQKTVIEMIDADAEKAKETAPEAPPLEEPKSE